MPSWPGPDFNECYCVISEEWISINFPNSICYMLVLLPSYLVWHGELEEVESVGVPLHDDLLQVLQVLKD